MSDHEEQESWDYTDEQRLVRYPGPYLVTGTEVVVRASIARNPMSIVERREHSLRVVVGTEADDDAREGDFEAVRYGANPREALTEAGVRSEQLRQVHFTDVKHGKQRSSNLIFERAVYCFAYDDEEMLRQVQGAMYAVNQAAIPEASLRSHRLTEEERDAAIRGDLDIITGFSIIDTSFRLIVVEGLGSGGMQAMHRRVQRKVANGPRCRILADPTVCFQERLYTAFDLDLKRIKLRDELPTICESPDIYNRAKVPLECFEALHRLFRMRSSMRLRHLERNNLFPTAPMLLRLESKYGEAISLDDMNGASGIIDPNATLADDDDDGNEEDMKLLAAHRATSREDSPEEEADAVDQGTLPVGGHSTGKRKADTDCWNDAYEDFLKAEAVREHPDFIRENEEMALKIREEVVARRAARPPVEIPEEMKGQIYIYSGQKLQLTEFQKENMRKRLSRRKNVTFTYSSEFQSQTVCLVNEDDIEKDAKAASRAKMTTQRGFVYPAPKDPSEYAKHPRQVSQARREQLREPWDEPGQRPLGTEQPQPWEMPGAQDFVTIPDLKPKLFGGYNADGTKQVDRDFYKSVHMGGDGVEEEQMEALKRARQEWKDAVIVDNIHFQPHYGERGEKPSQLGKLEDILAGGRPNKLGLKVVHRATLPSGKRIPLAVPPPSMLSGDPYADPEDFTAGMRPNDPAHFAGTDAAGNKVGFITTIHRDMLKPPLQKLMYNRKIEPMQEHEKVGPKFGEALVKERVSIPTYDPNKPVN